MNEVEDFITSLHFHLCHIYNYSVCMLYMCMHHCADRVKQAFNYGESVFTAVSCVCVLLQVAILSCVYNSLSSTSLVRIFTSLYATQEFSHMPTVACDGMLL